MGLDQYLTTDQYFSDTWDKTADQARQITQVCGIPAGLIDRINATVEITLMEWHKCYWLHGFILAAAQSYDGQQKTLIDNLVLERFISSADKIIDQDVNPNTGQSYQMWELFPYEDDWPSPQTYDSDDLETLHRTRDKFKQILNEIPDVDLAYIISV